MVNYAIISAAAAAILSSVVNAVPIPDNSYDSGSSSSYSSTATSTASSYAASSTGSSYNGGSSSSYNGGSSYGGSSSYNGGSYSTPMYGSGSSSWSMQSSYDSCVEQCIATYGSATVGSYDMNNTTMSSYDSSSYSGSSSSDCSGGDCSSSSSCSGGDCGSSSSSCSGGSCGGMTHTVMVAPTQGVLRYVPFAINASVGDTIKYVWGGNNHTVSLGSQLDLCNSSSNSTANFTSSGEHGMNFEYSVTINDTAPMYMYCATPGHCERGMFMIINPTMSNSSSYNMSAGNMIASMSNSTNSSIAYMQTMYSRQSGANSSMAANWGAGMNVSAVPAWAYESFMENVMYTRTFLAANNDLLNTDGSVNISKSAHPIVVPQDVTRAIINAAHAAPAAKQNKRDLDVEGQEQDIDFDDDSEDDAEDEEDDSVSESAVPVQTFKMAKRHSGARSTAAVSVLGSIVVLSVAAITAF